ncbi:MAG: LON peptidase substrate-binding domain-containing protein [Phycisphaerae bacterium]|nr:LON peptidase substrate-binding domain-containing protein [Phycisphaerae bacterium]
MSAERSSIQVNFGKPFPLFPLDGVVLLPHALLKLFIFEPRYKQMVERALDGPGFIAMAVFEGNAWKKEYHGHPPIRRHVCLGKIAQHQKLPDGNYNVLMQGVCRARIRQELPADEGRLYREAFLEPIEAGDRQEDDLFILRDGLLTSLRAEPLSELSSVQSVLNELDNREVPTPALIEVVTLSVLNDKPVQYRLLSEGDIFRRGEIVEKELGRLRKLLDRARLQHDPGAPDGVSWN